MTLANSVIITPSSNNAQVLDAAVTISSSNELEEFLHKTAAEDFLENFNRPDTKWKIIRITNLVFYINHLADAPLSGPVELPDFLTHNRGVVNHTANGNKKQKVIKRAHAKILPHDRV